VERDSHFDKKIHIARPATATEIRKALHVTRKDMKVVNEVLHDLFPKEFPAKQLK